MTQNESVVYQPVIPVGGFKTVIFRDVKIIHLPGALVIGQVPPLDQVMHIAIFVETGRRNINIGLNSLILYWQKSPLVGDTARRTWV